MANPVHTFTKLVDEPFFIQCARNLRAPDGSQAATITSIDTIRLERRVAKNPEEWEVAVAASGFYALLVLDDGAFVDSIVSGRLILDRDTSPPPGEEYMIVVECTVTFVAAFGGGTTGAVFRRAARIAAGSVTAPAAP